MSKLDKWLIVYLCRLGTIMFAIAAMWMSPPYAKYSVVLMMVSAAFWVFGDLYAKEKK